MDESLVTLLLDGVGWMGAIMIVALHVMVIRGEVQANSGTYLCILLLSVAMMLAPELLHASATTRVILLSGLVLFSWGAYKWWKDL